MTNKPLVSFITVVYNEIEVSLDLLTSFEQYNPGDWEIIVVDNGSLNRVQSFLEPQFPFATYLRSEKNLGFAGGNNLGITHAQGTFLFFINNDAYLTAGAVEHMLTVFSNIPKLGALSPLICFDPKIHQKNYDIIQYAGHTKVHWLTGRNRTVGRMETNLGNYSSPYKTAYTHGAAMMVRRDVLDSVGLMAPYYFLYYEELDWCVRMQKSGWEIMVAPQAKIYHKESITVGRESTLKVYYLNRNRILFMRIHQHPFWFWAFGIYWLMVAFPKGLLIYMIKMEWPKVSAFIKALLWNAKNTIPAAAHYPSKYLKG